MSGDYRESHVRKGLDYDETLAATPFDAYMAAQEARWLVRIVQNLHPQGIPRYLDFACGTGRVTRTVAPLAHESVGVDISPTMLAVAREKCPQTKFVCADLTRESVDLGMFDVVTSFRFFGNAQDDLRGMALRAIVERIRPGGHLVINNHRNPRSLAAMLDRATGGSQGMDLNYPKLRRLLSAHGLAVVRAHPIGVWLWRSRMLATVGAARDHAHMERLFGGSALVPIAPDAVVVARKAAGAS